MRLFFGSRQLAVAFGVKPDTVRKWIGAGLFPNAVQVQLQPRPANEFGPEVPHRTERGKWFVPIDDVEAWLQSLYSGERRIPPRVKEGLRRLAVELPRAGKLTRTTPAYHLDPLNHLAHPSPPRAQETQTTPAAEMPHLPLSTETEPKEE